jgi:hypothetical protein
MPESDIKTPWDALSEELAQWSANSRIPQLFLRDDDAVEVTPALARLTGLCEQWNIPLLLAVIPKFADDELADFVSERILLTPAVHGYCHANYAGNGEKSMELGSHRPLRNVLGELDLGREKLAEMFGKRLSKLLVPPWNRIGEQVASHIADIGFCGISGFGWKIPHSGITWVNTHVDIIDWKNGKTAKSIDDVMSVLTLHLKSARQRGFSQVGILTHHLQHNKQSWSMLAELFHVLGSHRSVEWVKADDLAGGLAGC